MQLTTIERQELPAVGRLVACAVLPGHRCQVRVPEVATRMLAQPVFQRHRHGYGENAQVEETPQDDEC